MGHRIMTEEKFDEFQAEVRKEALQEGFRDGMKTASGDYDREFHISADRVALEAARDAPISGKAKQYKETYEEVYRHLAKGHSTYYV